MHYLLVTIGARGYTLPFFSIAARLKAQGHRVTVIAEYGYADVAAAAGVEYVSLYSAAESVDVARDRWLLHSRRYDLLFLTRYMVGWNLAILGKIRECVDDGERVTVVSADRNVVWADLEAYSRWGGVRVVRAAVDLPKVWWEKSQASALQVRLLAEADRLWGGSIFGMYRRIRPLVDSIALWPGWLVPDSKARAFGFMPVVEAHEVRRSYGRLAFTAGTEGSLGGWLPRFEGVASRACSDLGMTGTMLGGGNPYAPLPDVLENAAAFVHHGGIGTIAAALEAGVPQLAIPRVAGQFANVEHLRRLGLCRVLKPEEWTAAGAAPAIRTVMSKFCQDVARCAAWGIDREASLEAVCGYLAEGK